MSTPGRLDLLGDVLDALKAQRDLSHSILRSVETVMAKHLELWQDNADLRDELHALANRVEALTRTRPAAVVLCTDSACRHAQSPHVHTTEGVVYR